jgi:hypothetical protein
MAMRRIVRALKRSVNWFRNQFCPSPSMILGLDLDSIRSVDPDPDSVGQKWPTKVEKNYEISCFEVLDVLF